MQSNFLTATGDGVVVRIWVKPNAAHSAILGVKGQRLQVKVAGPPVEGKANVELVKTLARFFGLRRSAVRVVQGAASRDKRVELRGVTLQKLTERLQSL